MAFKEVRRRSNLFRPWDSSISQTTNCTPNPNKSDSSAPVLSKSSSKPEYNVKRNGLKSDYSKRLEHMDCPPIRATNFSESECNSILCSSVSSIPNQWQPNLLQNSNHLAMIPRHDLMLCHPHSSFPFADHIFYEQLNQPLINSTPFSDQTLVNTSNITRQWRQIQQQKKQRPKRFQCPHCRVSFSNNGQLKGHIRIHTGERPFACDHPNCGKTFTRNEELTRHKRIHTGLRPYSCSVCGKRFGRKDHLKKHVKTHQRSATMPMHIPMPASMPYHFFNAVNGWMTHM